LTEEAMERPLSKPESPFVFAAKVAGLLAFSALVAFVSDAKLRIGPVAAVVLGLSSVTAYKILNFSVSMWLIRDLGFSEASAGMIIVVWGVFMSVATIVSGSLTDVLGLRKTLLFGVSVCVATRLVMALGPHPYIALLLGLIPLAVGEALCTPVLVAALRLYSKPSQRTVAFSLFYGLMNFGFMFGYFISDGITGRMKDGGTVTLPGTGTEVSMYGMLILASMGIDLLMFPLVRLLRPGVQMTEEGFVALPSHGSACTEGGTVFGRALASISAAARETAGMLAGLFRSPGFSKLLVFLLMIGLLKIVFNLMDYVLTPFTGRGEQGGQAQRHQQHSHSRARAGGGSADAKIRFVHDGHSRRFHHGRVISVHGDADHRLRGSGRGVARAGGGQRLSGDSRGGAPVLRHDVPVAGRVFGG
jgi:MFS family permease